MATGAGGFDALLSAFDRFYKMLDATTVPAEGGGRTVGGIAHAVALSEATSALYVELGATSLRLFQQHGQSVAEFPPGVALMESDSPDGPWTPIPAGEVRIASMGVGGNGADAMLLAALESATKVAAFPIDKWNAMQAARPGANHQRFHAGEVVSWAGLALLESAAKLLHMKAPPAPSTESKIPELVAQLKAATDALPAVLEGNRAGFERVAGVIESLGARDDDDAPAATLPELGPRDREAWQASLVAGMTQGKIADAMNNAHPGENWTQPRVSEAIKRAKAHAEASGLADKVSATRSQAPARTLDPAAADSGQRTDGRSKHLREKARQIATEE